MLTLDPRDYPLAARLTAKVPFNTLFAQVVLDRQVRGTVYVDNPQNPAAALVFHPYGMLLLCGMTENPVFRQGLVDLMLRTRYPQPLWLQVYPEAWSALLPRWLGERLQVYPAGLPPEEAEQRFKAANRSAVVECTRVNFRFNPARYPASTAVPGTTGPGTPECTLRPIDRALYERLDGPVTAPRFWDSFTDFAARGVGFCLLRDQTILSSCCTAFVLGDQYEIGLETAPGWRGQGYAGRVARAFIDDCLPRGREPVWACRIENTASYRLALSLGFEEIRRQPYYALVNNSP